MIGDYFFELVDGDGYGLRGHRLKLKVQRCRLQVRQNFFSVRIVNLWNKLPEVVVESSSVNVFKNRLDEWIADVGFLKFCFSSNTSQVTSYKLIISFTYFFLLLCCHHYFYSGTVHRSVK